MNATSGDISPNPEGCVSDYEVSDRGHKSKHGAQQDHLHHVNSISNHTSKKEGNEVGDREGMKEGISGDEEEEEDMDEEDVDTNLSMMGVNSIVDMSLEDAKYALKHIENEKSTNESTKKCLKPPYRYHNNDDN